VCVCVSMCTHVYVNVSERGTDWWKEEIQWKMATERL